MKSKFQAGASITATQPPIYKIENENPQKSMINSVDFHPYKNLLCATLTHNNQIIIYEFNKSGNFRTYQVLSNPESKLSNPQHALFSKDGSNLLTTNWRNQTFNIFTINKTGFFEPNPIAVVPYSQDLDSDNYRPHGMTFSSTGAHLAVVYGASKSAPRAVALYEVRELNSKNANFKLLSLLIEKDINHEIPKGVTFSPDESCLIVTFATTHSLVIYEIDWKNSRIISTPRQILSGPATHLSRPEDIKFTINGNYCAVTNSSEDTITFYKFDKENNYFVQDKPFYILKNPEAQLTFPHGLAFSFDGKYLSVSQFGDVQFNDDGNLSSWAQEEREKITIYSSPRL